MNRYFIALMLFTLFGCAMSVSAQRTHLPILEPGKSWKCVTSPWWDGSMGSISTVTVVGDTIVNDTIATKLRSYAYGGYIGYYAAYEDSGRVYMYSEDLGHFLNILDYNYTTGEEIDRPMERYGSSKFTIERDEVVNMYGIDRRILYISFKHNYCWIEGVGSYILQEHYINPFPLDFIGAYSTRLVACYKDGECIFSEDWLKEYSGVKEVGVDTAALPGAQQIYDVYGRRVTNPLPGSIYIVDGRKVVWQ